MHDKQALHAAHIRQTRQPMPTALHCHVKTQSAAQQLDAANGSPPNGEGVRNIAEQLTGSPSTHETIASTSVMRKSSCFSSMRTCMAQVHH